MKQGALVEYGEPHKLLEQQGSYFKRLYEDVGKGAGAREGEDEIEVLPK